MFMFWRKADGHRQGSRPSGAGAAIGAASPKRAGARKRDRHARCILFSGDGNAAARTCSPLGRQSPGPAPRKGRRLASTSRTMAVSNPKPCRRPWQGRRKGSAAAGMPWWLMRRPGRPSHGARFRARSSRAPRLPVQARSFCPPAGQGSSPGGSAARAARR